MSKVDKCGLGGGSSYSRRPQTVPFVCDSLQLLDTYTAIPRNGSEVGQSHPILRYCELNTTQQF